MKVRIKEVRGLWTPGLVSKDSKYDFIPRSEDNSSGYITNDAGFNIFILINGCSFLDGGSWEIIPDTAGDESEERMESMMLHGTEG